jgi:D-alanyl-D-alanine carboxypeptidase/D-alanyl-D-alanine-endopeptidase (penicillin-binding protein 4)
MPLLRSPAALLSRRSFLGAMAVMVAAPELRAEDGRSLEVLVANELTLLATFVKNAGGRIGACFVDVETGIEIGALSPDVPENPASNAKLVTAGAALAKLGGNFVFTSGLYGTIADGRVANLVLRSDGDPSLTSADLALLASALRERGAREVGDVLIDQSAFDEQYVPPAFEQQPQEWAAFRAPVSAVAVDRNSVTVTIAPTTRGSDARVVFEPQGFVEMEGRIETVARGKRAQPHAGLAPRGSHLVAKLGGAIHEGAAPLRYRQRVDDPRLFPAYALRAALASVGIGVAGTLRLGGANEQNELAVHRSRPLAELVQELGKASDNFYAEMLLKALGAKAKGRPATSAAGAELATAWLREIGAFEPGVRVGNGSGLYDANRLTARSITRLLAAVRRDPVIAEDFIRQLAIGGVDGTLKSRFTKLAAGRTLLAKTGTLRDVVALSGFVSGPQQRHPVAFSVIVSNVNGKTLPARKRIDVMIERIANELARDATAPASAAPAVPTAPAAILPALPPPAAGASPELDPNG